MWTKICTTLIFSAIVIGNLFWFHDLFLLGTMSFYPDLPFSKAIVMGVVTILLGSGIWRLSEDTLFTFNYPYWLLTILCSLLLLVMPIVVTQLLRYDWNASFAWGNCLGACLVYFSLFFSMDTWKSEQAADTFDKVFTEIE